MTALQPERCDDGLEPLNSVERRFGLEILDVDLDASVAVMSMPAAGLTNPFTGAPTLGPLAILVDAAAGRANHFRRGIDEWTVSSELCLELSPSVDLRATDDPQHGVLATAHALGRKGLTSVSLCTLTKGAETIGCGTVRSYFVPADRVVPDVDGSPPMPNATLAELTAVQIRSTDDEGSRTLMQLPNPAINNRIGAVHGGVATAGLELAASAVLNTHSHHMTTASIRVNFLRPFLAGEDSRYVATALRVGRTSGVADAQAIGEDGKPAIVARITAYR